MSREPSAVAHDAALVGTARATAGEVQAAAAALLGPGGGSDESRLLELAAATGRLLRATSRPLDAQARSATEPAPPAPRPPSAASRAELRQLLLTGHPDSQVEGLRWLVELGLGLDAENTVRVLETATARTGLRRAAWSAIGARGGWLAGLNPAWAWAERRTVQAEPEARWDLATRAERVALLRALRAADPARALAMLQRSWDTDRADDLAALLPELGVGLSASDEPALESRLDDTRVQVRRAAAALLAQVEGSRFVGRAVGRAAAYLSVSGRLRKTLSATPPKAADAEMTRDAVETTRLPQLGAQASLLAHDLALVPPARLAEVLGVDRRRLVALVRECEWWPSLQHALLVAGHRHGDAELLLELTPHLPLHELVRDLADDAAVAEILSAHGDLRSKDPDQHVAVLNSVPGPWGLLTSRALLPVVTQAVTLPGKGRWGLAEACRTAGRSLHVATQVPHVEPRDDHAREAFDQLLQTFAHRQRLHQVLLHDKENT